MSNTAVTPESTTTDTESDQIVHQHATLRADLATLRADLAHAAAAQKANTEEKINTTKTKMRAAMERAHTRTTTLEQEADAKVKEMETQRATANAEKKAQLDARIAATRADYEQRAAKLHQANELTKEALTR